MSSEYPTPPPSIPAFFLCMAMMLFALGEVSHAQTCSNPHPLAGDRNALIRLYCATDGPNWKNTWTITSQELKSWHGVVLNTEERVSELDLGNNSLSGTIPAELGTSPI